MDPMGMLKLLMGRPYIVLCPLDFVGVAPNLVRPAAAEGVSFGCLCAPCVVVEPLSNMFGRISKIGMMMFSLLSGTCCRKNGELVTHGLSWMPASAILHLHLWQSRTTLVRHVFRIC
jgi:hypothetical protein